MSGFKLLIDTNVVIALEDAHAVPASFAELARLCGTNAVGLFVDGANYEDVGRDKNEGRRTVTLSKLPKFQQLGNVPMPPPAELVARFGEIKNDNDRSDVRLLAILDANAVDFVVTQDIKMHRRAERAGLGASVMTIEGSVEWLNQTFSKKPVKLPYVAEKKAYEIELRDPILDSIRLDYPDFDEWFNHCRKSHRECWVLEIDDQIAGIVIRKEETHADAKTRHPGPKILKICTMKVRDDFYGEKFGELLLKQVLWFAQRNSYDLVYLTAFPKHEFLINLLQHFGFERTIELANGEWVLEKVMARGPLSSPRGDIYEEDRRFYPRFHEGAEVGKFCIPIQPDYHRKLFPEIAKGIALPLFPDHVNLIDQRGDRTPGNTIRKVYLCRSKITRLRPGSIVLFYMSKGEGFALSQSITTVGVVEQVRQATSGEDLLRWTGKRSVFSEVDLHEWSPTTASPVKVIDFLLAGHVEPAIGLDALVSQGIFNGRPPQSISEIDSQRYILLRNQIRLGF